MQFNFSQYAMQIKYEKYSQYSQYWHFHNVCITQRQISKENKNEDENGISNSSIDSNASEAQHENNKTRSRPYSATLGINGGNTNCTHFDKILIC